jgi:hypothetical protein
VRTNRLPADTRMAVVEDDAQPALGDTQPRRTLAQELVNPSPEPRDGATSATRFGAPEASAARRLDLDLVARLNRDFDRRGQRF